MRGDRMLLGFLLFAGSVLGAEPEEAKVKAHELRWNDALKEAVSTATRLRIRSGGTCHREPAEEKTLFETQDVDTIHAFVKMLAVNQEKSGFHCMCCGDPSFEFYKGEKQLVMLGFHHGRSIRWPGGWPGDGLLEEKGATALVKWLEEHSVTGPADELREEKARYEASERKTARATAGLSETLKTAFKKGTDEFRKALNAEYPKAADRIRVLLRAFGASGNSWSMLDWQEQRAETLLKEFRLDDLAPVCEAALLGTDRQLRRGAARLWRSWESPLEAWKPEDAPLLHRILVTVQQEARYAPLRQSALDGLRTWAADFTPEELNRRLMAGLRDPEEGVRRKAMIVAGRMRHAPAEELLLKVLNGEPVEPLPLPDVPKEETEDVSSDAETVGGRNSMAEIAALALGYLQSAKALPLIETKAGDNPSRMFRVAQALLGRPDLLKQEDFQTEDNNQELQFAALAAVIRCKGRHGLDLAVNYRQATHWWEEERVAQWLTSMLIDNHAPATQELGGGKSLEDLRAWFKRHGQEYVRMVRDAP